MSETFESALRDHYLDLLKRTLTNYVYLGGEGPFEKFYCAKHYDLEHGTWTIDAAARPLTLLTARQLSLIERVVQDLETRKVPGDYIEAGVWRGGAVAFMRALLRAYSIDGRCVVAADSFSGIPLNRSFRHDPVDLWPDRWAASLEEVRSNIARFGLLDDGIEFLPGEFSETLGQLEGRRFAMVRLDSDSFESVQTSLEYLYPLLSEGGVLIIDDWHLIGCKMAVGMYRDRSRISTPIETRAGNALWVKQEPWGYPQPTICPRS